MSEFEQIKDKSNKYLINNYNRQDIAFQYGSGELLFDYNGKSYIDFVSGIAVNALGHSNADWIEALRDQADKLSHTSNLYYNKEQADLAEILIANSFENGKALFVNSGTEANEAAFKLARKYGLSKHSKKIKILSMEKSFHGRTLASMHLTGQDKIHEGFGPAPDGFNYIEANDIDQLEASVDESTCAIFLEPIIGESGVIPLTEEFIAAAKELCEDFDALLIFDEVQTGLGRTGDIFAFQHYGIEPDVITLAKGLGAGFPMGALLTNEKAANIFSPGDHGSTFGGNHLACRIAMENCKIIFHPDFLKKINKGSKIIVDVFKNLQNNISFVNEYRGRGYMQALVLDASFNKGNYKELVSMAMDAGLLINLTSGNIIRILPPLNILDLKLIKGLEVLESVLTEFYNKYK